MTEPADRPPCSARLRRSCARPPSALLGRKAPVGCTPLSLPQDGSRSRRRRRDPSAESEGGPTAATRESVGLSRGVLRDLQEAFNDARRTLPLRFFVVELLAPGARQCVDPHAT